MIEVRLHRGEAPRIDIIRAAAAKLLGHRGKAGTVVIDEYFGGLDQLPARSAAAPARTRAPLATAAERAAHTPPPLPPSPVEQRRAALAAAIRFLAAQGVLVSVVSKFDAIRMYWISGRGRAVFAEDVIELAQARGMGS